MIPVSSPSVLGSDLVYNFQNQGESGSSGLMHWSPTSNPHLPERPDQPECRHFMSTGICKYGSHCKYHHPRERIAQLTTSSLGPLGLPLRPVSSILFLLTGRSFGHSEIILIDLRLHAILYYE